MHEAAAGWARWGVGINLMAQCCCPTAGGRQPRPLGVSPSRRSSSRSFDEPEKAASPISTQSDSVNLLTPSLLSCCDIY